jgi:hypothetical protein
MARLGVPVGGRVKNLAFLNSLRAIRLLSVISDLALWLVSSSSLSTPYQPQVSTISTGG